MITLIHEYHIVSLAQFFANTPPIIATAEQTVKDDNGLAGSSAPMIQFNTHRNSRKYRPTVFCMP